MAIESGRARSVPSTSPFTSCQPRPQREHRGERDRDHLAAAGTQSHRVGQRHARKAIHALIVTESATARAAREGIR